MIAPTSLIRTQWPPNDGLRPGNERFDRMLHSVRGRGIVEPLTVDMHWLLIDGHHRLEAARILGIKKVEVRVWTGTEYAI